MSNEFEDDIIDEEFELEENDAPSLLDIYPPFEMQDVDVSSIFVLSKLQLTHLEETKSTKDIFQNKKETLSFPISHHIKLLKLQKPLTDIVKKKKNKDVNLGYFQAKSNPYSLDLQDLENIALVNIGHDIRKKEFPTYYKTLFFLKRSWKFFKHFFSQKNHLMYLATFFALFVSLWIYKVAVEYKLYQTVESVKNFELSGNITESKEKIGDLKNDFFALKMVLQPVFFINGVLNSQDISNLENIILGGNNILNSVVEAGYLYDSFVYNIEQKGWNEVYFGDFFLNAKSNISEIEHNFIAGVQALQNVKIEEKDPLFLSFSQQMNKLNQLQGALISFGQNSHIIEQILGNEKKRKYMIVLQNNDEIRPTGGFMGSVMFVEVYRGKIVSQDKKDIYALEWPLKPFTQIAPEGIHKISPTYGLRDANYYLETQKSSQEINKFLKKSNSQVDGIIYINQNVIRDLLQVTGKIDFPEVKREVDSENFSWIFSTLVESKVFKEGTLGTPKQILFDFIPVFLKQIDQNHLYGNIAKSLLDSLQKRDIIVWSAQKEENDFLQKMGLRGDEINYQEYSDFSYPYFTSISGNKSDRYIERTFTKKYSFDPNCTLNTSFEISQKHLYGVNDEIAIKNYLYDMDILGKVELGKTLSIQGKAENRQFVRVYIPKNAIIKENPELKIRQLDDKKEVSFYLNTPLNTTRSFEFSYQLPNPECKNYSFQFFKQPGIGQYNLEIQKDGEIKEQQTFQKDYFYEHK